MKNIKDFTCWVIIDTKEVKVSGTWVLRADARQVFRTRKMAREWCEKYNNPFPFHQRQEPNRFVVRKMGVIPTKG